MSLIKNFFKIIIFKILSFRKLKNIIIFESSPDLSGNSFELYKYAKKEKLDKKYKIIWAVSNYNQCKLKYKDVEFIKYPTNRFEQIKFLWKISQAKCLIYENKELKKINKKQYAIYLTHGTPLKNTHSYMWQQENIDHVLFQSNFVKENAKRLFNVNDNQLVCLGFPRNDLLFSNINLNHYLKHEYKKIVVWLPTFRQYKDNKRVDSNFSHPLGIPIFKEESQMIQLNNFLNNHNSLLLIKPHPGQLTKYLKNINLTNVKIIFDQDINDMNIQLYELLAGSDALITDYSSVYFDYLLTNKPIGITIDDIENYRNTLGFAFENVESILVGEKICEFKDLVLFFDNLINDIDSYYEARRKNCDLFNYYKDNNSTKRVYDFIINNMNNR